MKSLNRSFTQSVNHSRTSRNRAFVIRLGNKQTSPEKVAGQPLTVSENWSEPGSVTSPTENGNFQLQLNELNSDAIF